MIANGLFACLHTNYFQPRHRFIATPLLKQELFVFGEKNLPPVNYIMFIIRKKAGYLGNRCV